MAIDTRNKRANAMRINIPFLFMGLSPTSGMDDDDRENAGRGYIGFDYDGVTPGASIGYRSRIRLGLGVGF